MKASERLGAAASFGQLSERRQLINQAAGRSSISSSSVELEDLTHNPFNPRLALDELEETAASLQEKGQLTALTVVTRVAFLNAHPGHEEEIGEARWIVLDGNRRLAAARRAGLSDLRIDVNDALAPDATGLLENSLVANLHRVDVPPLDEAKAIRDLVKIHGSQGEVAKRLSKSGAWISQRLALLELPEDLQEKVETGELKVKDGRRIGRLPEPEQRAEAERALNRVKEPRAAKAKPAPPSEPVVPQQSTAALNPVKSHAAAEEPAPAPAAAPTPVNPVKGHGPNQGRKIGDFKAHENLPWDDPAWFDLMLRRHMSDEHRETLVWLLTATE
jgi:ParB family chromosome partitioning protein